MKRPGLHLTRLLPVLFLLLLPASETSRALAPTPAALAAFDAYINKLERSAAQHQPPGAAFAPANSPDVSPLHEGQFLIENLAPPANVALPGTAGIGAALHHWRGRAFVPGAHAADFEALLRNVPAYPNVFAPQVLRAEVLSRTADHLGVLMRVEQHHGLTVVLDTAYDVSFGRLDPQHAGTPGWSTSRSTAIQEIDAAGTPREHALSPAEAHGFLWRLNTYWTFQERDGGLYLQIETVSLTRAIPHGLGWLVGPYAETIPRDSLAFTLRSACNALPRR